MISGIVYIVGAGPGDPGLITVKGVECLRRADVIIYDRLVSPHLLDYAPFQAERIYVGKASSDHIRSQKETNRLLVEKARQGKTVVRLKGGDPFVFGRGGEEALALAEAGIPFEVVPGVTSAIAAPAYAGIPVTHRGVARSFAVFSGHRAELETRGHGDAETAAESRQASADTLGSERGPWNVERETLIVLMGVENLGSIVASLLEEGYSLETPVALVRWGTTPQQETVVGTLGDIVERGRELYPPAVLVVGQVVSLRERLKWFEDRPLFGKRILVTRFREQRSELSCLLAEQGAEPIDFPVIQILPTEDNTPLDEALALPHDWVIFTSANGVKAVWDRLQAAGRDARAFAGVRLCAIGLATAAELAAHGLHADFVLARHIAEAAVAGIGDATGQRILLPRADIAQEALAQGLRQKGAFVDEVVAYRTAIASDPTSNDIRAMLQDGQIDAIVFTSPSTVRGFFESKVQSPKSKAPIVACIGPVTAQTARDLGLRVDVVAKEHTVKGLVAALVDYYQKDGSRGLEKAAEGPTSSVPAPT
ncbi:MAG: uroporphyrinogen-III C-methyltransferase [Chloroflexota bacterium]